MRKLQVINFVALFLLFGCGMSEKDKNEISQITCNIINATRGMDAAQRIKEVNAAREQMGEERFLGTDEDIIDSVQFGLCINLVRNDEDYLSLLETKKEEKIAQEKLAAEKLAEKNRVAAEELAEWNRIEAEKRAERERIAAEERAEENRIAAEKQRIADSKPTVKEEFYGDGKLKSRTNYQSKNDGGKQHGLRESYYSNGQLRVKVNYKDGEWDGLWESYHENGKLLSTSCYDNGEEVDMSRCEK